MRYAKDHKEQTRRRVLDVASKVFRRNGIEASGLVGLMAEAGLTQGAFYSHFASKEALAAEAVTSAFVSLRRRLAATTADARDRGIEPAGALIDGYLNGAHLRSPEYGCPFAALGPELGRQSPSFRRSSFAAAEELSDLLAAELKPELRGRASAVMSLMMGAIQFARLAPTGTEANAILASGREAAYSLAGLGTPPLNMS